jgi:dTMP kinase
VNGSKTFFGAGLPYCDISELKGKLIVLEGTDGVGRSSQIVELKKWLEYKGFGVYTTGLARSPLMGKVIERAKLGHNLNVLTYSLLYLADFADRLEHEVIPALRSGFIVLADRYMYTSIARAVVRGADREWIRNCFSIALQPDLVIYLKIRVKELIPRVINSRNLTEKYWEAQGGEGMDYWESGMDMGMGGDLYDSFVKYQKNILSEFDQMSEEFAFSHVDASQSFETTNEHCKRLILPVIEDAA